MLVQNYFTEDVIRDSKLCSIAAYSLHNANSTKKTRFLSNDTPIILEPYQVLFEYEKVKNELGMELDEFMLKLDKLSHLFNIKINKKESYAIVHFKEINNQIVSISLTPEPIEGQNMVLSQWLELDEQQFLSFQSPSYLKNTKLIVAKFIEFVGDKTLSAINKRDYERFVHHMKDVSGIKTTSINDYTRALKAWIRRAVKKGYIEFDPFKGLKQMPEQAAQKVIWEKEEIAAALNCQEMPLWLANAIWVALHTGMRRGEVINLLWKNVDLDEMQITVTNTEVHTTKFNKTRIIPITGDLKRRILEIKEQNKINGIESEYVICDERGFHIEGGRVQKKLKRIMKREKLRVGLNFHGFRKTFASELKRKRIPQYIISEILGHADEKVTSRYIGVPNDDIIAAMQSISDEDYNYFV